VLYTAGSSIVPAQFIPPVALAPMVNGTVPLSSAAAEPAEPLRVPLT
jgi:hypothetical protein